MDLTVLYDHMINCTIFQSVDILVCTDTVP